MWRGYQLLFIGFHFFCYHAVSGTHRERQPFSWKSCGDSNALIKVSSLNVYQNDSNNLYISGSGKVGIDIKSPIQGHLEMKKRIAWVWVPIPCVDDFGTCSYDDICSLTPYTTDCPKIYTDNNLPCHCPILQGKYAFENVPMNIDILPKWLERGLYLIRVTLKWGGKEILCMKMNIDI